MGVLAYPHTYVSHLTVGQDFYCTLPTPTDYSSRFPASESTSFDALTDAVYASLSSTNLHSRPWLIFKLSTNPKSAPWDQLNSPEDWGYAIRRVYIKKDQQRGTPRWSVDIQIRVSDMVRYSARRWINTNSYSDTHKVVQSRPVVG